MAVTTTPTMKKFLNDPADLVPESLAGLAAAHGDLLRYDADAKIVVRADASFTSLAPAEPVPGAETVREGTS